MTTSKLIGLIARTGRIAEPAPQLGSGRIDGARPLRGSVHVRYVDLGGATDCAMEIAAAFGPVYDLERYGIRLVASPRHADVLLITGVVTRNMVEPLRLTIEAVPRPRLIVAVGDAAIAGGAFAGGYGVAGVVSDFAPVDLEIPGSPPEPAEIVAALRMLSGR